MKEITAMELTGYDGVDLKLTYGSIELAEGLAVNARVSDKVTGSIVLNSVYNEEACKEKDLTIEARLCTESGKSIFYYITGVEFILDGSNIKTEKAIKFIGRKIFEL